MDAAVADMRATLAAEVVRYQAVGEWVAAFDAIRCERRRVTATTIMTLKEPLCHITRLVLLLALLGLPAWGGVEDSAAAAAETSTQERAGLLMSARTITAATKAGSSSPMARSPAPKAQCPR